MRSNIFIASRPAAGCCSSAMPGCVQYLLLPGLEGFREDAVAGRAFLDRQDGAAVVVVNDRYVKPGALLEELQIAVLVGVGGGEADQEETGRDLDGEPRERDAARLLGLLHQDA